MSESPHRTLFLVTGGLSTSRLEELRAIAARAGGATEILTLTETNGREALEKIFAAHAVSVWGELAGEKK